MIGGSEQYSIYNNYSDDCEGPGMGMLNILSLPLRAVAGGVNVDVISGERRKQWPLLGKICLVIFSLLVAPIAVIAVVSFLIKAALMTFGDRKVEAVKTLTHYAGKRKEKKLKQDFKLHVRGLVRGEKEERSIDSQAKVESFLNEMDQVDGFSTSAKVIKFLDELSLAEKKRSIVECLMRRLEERSCEFHALLTNYKIDLWNVEKNSVPKRVQKRRSNRFKRPSVVIQRFTEELGVIDEVDTESEASDSGSRSNRDETEVSDKAIAGSKSEDGLSDQEGVSGEEESDLSDGTLVRDNDDGDYSSVTVSTSTLSDSEEEVTAIDVCLDEAESLEEVNRPGAARFSSLRWEKMTVLYAPSPVRVDD